jgi:cytochrome bd-type quinol oxidase subunit 2
MREILPIKSLFTLYIIISGNFLISLLGCKIQYLFNHNMFIKHLLGFITLLFFVVLGDDEYNSKDPNKQLLFTLGIYLLFIITTRIHYNTWVIFILISATIYILDIYLKNDNVEKSTKDTIQKIEKVLFILNAIVIMVGFFVYLGDKKIEYNKDFNYLTFMFGKPECKKSDLVNHSFLHSLKNALK